MLEGNKKHKKNLRVCLLLSPKWKLRRLCLKLYTWSPSMPLLTPPRRKGGPAPMLKEANYSQYLPVSPTLRGGEVTQRTGMWSIPAACCWWTSLPAQSSLSSFLCLHPRPPPAPLLLRPARSSSIPHFVFQSFCEQLVTSCVEPSIKECPVGRQMFVCFVLWGSARPRACCYLNVSFTLTGTKLTTFNSLLNIWTF